ncbi:MAG: tRNA (adenosine(37)-N6)-threonylcarbamoyltransferase complex dimerization subunit type 1 TsaB [Erysipelotrichaceae bacterium]
MKTLCIDTSTTYLVVALVEQERVVAAYEEEMPKQQSEYLLPVVAQLMHDHNWSVDDLDAVCVSAGPGSYTGVRIGMTMAKVLCSQKPIALYTVSTFSLLAGNNSGHVVIDARSKKVYYALVENGRVVHEPTLEKIDQLHFDGPLYGDAHLFGKECSPRSLAQHFVAVMPHWQRVANVHALVPTYIKGHDQ